MFVGAARSISDQPSLKFSWKIFLQALSLETEMEGVAFNLHLGTYCPTIWLAKEHISIEIESYDKAERTAGKSIRYQDAADQSNFPILCIKGFPQPYRYSVRLFAPRNKAHIYPKFYWATFAEGECKQLCLLEGDRYWYVQHQASINSVQVLSAPKRESELILKALDCANSRKL